MLATGALLTLGCDGGDLALRPLRPAPQLAAARPTGQSGTFQSPDLNAGKAPRPASTPDARLEADKLTTHIPRTLTYDMQGGKAMIVVQDALPDCHCAGRNWWVRYYQGDTHAQPIREVKYVIDHNGYVAAAEEIDRADKVEVVYTPPLVVVPDKLPPKSVGNSVFEQEVNMVIHPLGDRTKVKMHGPARNEIVFEGDEPLHTGAGEFTAHRITATVIANLSGAKTTDVTEQWLVDGIGVAAEREHEETRVLGAKVRDNTTMMLLKSFDQSRGAQAPGVSAK